MTSLSRIFWLFIHPMLKVECRWNFDDPSHDWISMEASLNSKEVICQRTGDAQIDNRQGKSDSVYITVGTIKS